MAMRRPAVGSGGTADGPPEQCDLALMYENLFEFLTEDQWDDGKRRQPGSLLIFVEEGTFKGMLNDKDLSRVTFFSAKTMSGVLDAAEQGLRTGSLDWRKSKPWKK